MSDIGSVEYPLKTPPLYGMSAEGRQKIEAMKDPLPMEISRRLNEILPTGNTALRLKVEMLIRPLQDENKQAVLAGLDSKTNTRLAEIYNRPGVTINEQVLFVTKDGETQMGCIFECPAADNLPEVKMFGLAYSTPMRVKREKIKAPPDVSDITGIPEGAVVAMRTPF
jgi:hypothetical protein